MWQFAVTHRREILVLTSEHLWLVSISMLLAIVIGVPLGIFLTRHPAWKGAVLGLNSVIQTIPGLALFGLLLPLPWFGARSDRLAITALTLYALLPIIQNTFVGISGVDTPVRDAAIAMGLTGRQLLWQVELPLSADVIVAGIRVSTVLTVGLATIAAAIGSGGLGEFIFRGLSMVDNRVILVGAIPRPAPRAPFLVWIVAHSSPRLPSPYWAAALRTPALQSGLRISLSNWCWVSCWFNIWSHCIWLLLTVAFIWRAPTFASNHSWPDTLICMLSTRALLWPPF
jgi:osmoprotectant transport system permease protein